MLEVNDINVSYGAITAVRNISFRVEESEIVALIGNNGAGKSTVLKAISGIIPSQQGEIKFLGSLISGLAPHLIAAKGITMVPEGRRVFAQMSVIDNLDMGAFLCKKKSLIKKNMDHVFSLFPVLAERRYQKAGTLSGGEQQMLAMGRAIMAMPKILLLDEPSLGLAPKVVETIYDTIKIISNEGTTILLVEQNVHLSLSVAKRAYVIETGKIVISGDANELANNDMVKRAYLGLEDDDEELEAVV